MKHTPGPWEVDKETGEITARETVLGIIYGVDDFPCYEGEDIDEECKANASLVAAAPDLLEAAKLALEKCPFPVGAMKAKEALRTAIAKAEETE